MTRHSQLLLALTLLIAVTGCGMKTPALAFSDDGAYLPRKVGQGLVASANPLIPDVPMPIGFKAVPSKSHWHYNGQIRTVTHVYQGHCEQGDALSFYREQLPDYNWTLDQIQTVADASVMYYNKGPERLTVTSTYAWGVATITIEIDRR